LEIKQWATQKCNIAKVATRYKTIVINTTQLNMIHNSRKFQEQILFHYDAILADKNLWFSKTL